MIRYLLSAIILMLFLFLTGCGGKIEAVLENKPLCECKEDFTFPEVVHIADSFFLRGDCKIDIPQESISESYSLKMYYQPPSFIYLQGDHFLMGKAIVAGGNTDKFWLWIRHNEVDSYWLGQWNHGCMKSSVSLPLNPSVILEAMGISYCQQKYNRVGCSCNAYVFDRYLPDGSRKKLWFDCCDKNLRKIELFATDGQMILLCKVKKYLNIADAGQYQLPALLEILIYSDGVEVARADIEFNPQSYKLREYSEKFHQRYFSPPEPKGAKHIYHMLEDGSFKKISGN